MTNNDRFWDSAIAEAVSGHQPPDQSAEILARLHAPAGSASARPRSLRRRLALHVLHAAGAAVVLCVIGLATGLLKWPWAGTDPEVSQHVVELIAAPEATWRQEGDWVVLDSGALLVSTGAPPVRRGESTLENVQGLALVHAGQEPTAEQKATLDQWLQTKGVEVDMIRNATKWMQGTALCVLMLQGSATMDGQKVEAEKPAAEPVWHRVNNVMDIDNLPKGATHVNADRLNCSHLDFLSEIPSIEAISICAGQQMREEYLQSLAKLPKLALLDLRYVGWVSGETPTYGRLLDFRALKKVALDPMYSLKGQSGVIDYESRLNASIEVSAALMAKGVEIEFGVFDARIGDLVRVADKLPQLRGITLSHVTDADIKTLTRLENLDSVTILDSDLSDVAFAYLARGSRITRLTFSGGCLSLAVFHQLAKVSNLRQLTIAGELEGVPGECLAQLGKLKSLEELDLTGIEVDGESKRTLGIPELAALPPLKILKASTFYSQAIVEAIPVIKAKRVEIDFGREFAVWSLQPVSEDGGIKTGDGLVETLVLRAEAYHGVPEDEYDAHDYDWQARLLAACPKLSRIEIKHAENVTPAMVVPLLKHLRKLAPKVEVVYVP